MIKDESGMNDHSRLVELESRFTELENRVYLLEKGTATKENFTMSDEMRAANLEIKKLKEIGDKLIKEREQLKSLVSSLDQNIDKLSYNFDVLRSRYLDQKYGTLYRFKEEPK